MPPPVVEGARIHLETGPRSTARWTPTGPSPSGRPVNSQISRSQTCYKRPRRKRLDRPLCLLRDPFCSFAKCRGCLLSVRAWVQGWVTGNPPSPTQPARKETKGTPAVP